MSNQDNNNKRIAKNTMLMYVRMLYSLFLSLFTARVILNALGVEDYGLYNVIGSIVSLFVVIRSAMGNSVSRYLTYSIGKNDVNEVQRIFSASLTIFAGLASLIFVLCETVGLWFLYNKLNIPDGRALAAFWVFQLSIFSSIIAVISVPYDSILIAHERMNVYAFVQIVTATLNLGIVYFVAYTSFDKLIVYALLQFLVLLATRIFYGMYCGKHFPEVKFKFIKDKSLYKEMTSFAGWSLFGNVAYVAQNQGINVMLNLFFSTVVNTARGIAYQVQGAIKGFIMNFQMAAFPQITKSYAAGDRDRMFNLIFFVSKFSYFLLLFLGLAIFIEAEEILLLWLKIVPDHTVAFLRIILLISLIETLSNPIATAISATGNIKTYQIILASIDLTILPLGYIALLLGCRVEIVFVIQLAIILIEQCVRVLLARQRLGLSARKYIKDIAVRVLLVTILSFVLPAFFYYFMETGIIRLLCVLFSSMISVLLSSMLLGLNGRERNVVLGYIKDFGRKFKLVKQV